MSVVTLVGLSAAEAEEAIARVWRVLEAHRITTPQMTVTHHGGVGIELSFTSSAHAELVKEALRKPALAASNAERVS